MPKGAVSIAKQLDTKIKIVELDEQNNHSKFVIMPLEREYGTIPEGSLRRVLLSSLLGAAISRVNVQSVAHKMSTIKDVKEDAPEIILDLKNIAVKKYNEGPVSLNVGIEGPCVLTTKDILADTNLEVKNPDHYIATLNEDTSLEMQITVINGKGYKISEFNKTDEDIIEDIAIDSLFSLMKRVNFAVGSARVGQVISYDELIIEVWTNGTIRPQDVLDEGSNILINCLELSSELPNCECNTDSGDEDNQKDKETQIVINIEELDFLLRSFNCLRRANINTVGDIVSHTKTGTMKIKNFSKKSLDEIEEKFQEMDLAFKQEIKDE